MRSRSTTTTRTGAGSLAAATVGAHEVGVREYSSDLDGVRVTSPEPLRNAAQRGR